MNNIFDFLLDEDLISPDRSIMISQACRDLDVSVYRDTLTDIIYLDPTYAGKTAHYYTQKNSMGCGKYRSEVDLLDAERRTRVLSSLIPGRRWLDFGCGPGYQLRKDAHLCLSAIGIEINEGDRDQLRQDGFHIESSLEQVTNFQPEVISLFHVLEHLLSPQDILEELKSIASKGCQLIIEVPHAKDWLLLNGPEEYRQFTFWSEHLVLHTRASLHRLLEKSGWTVQSEVAVQRYPIWNHLYWLTDKKPSGMGNTIMDESARILHEAYGNYNSIRNCTDTLLFIARC
ncbi:class I SAM-dependent methyltransferase [Aeromonas dhakensis]|uniref:class I SAM-dependent methyltransferase n=1 Tax=Aeromonas dhakensis TaxID=196024 RepID=UPI001BCF6077|nr:class I SAM-dependent methyltransferase [Aeromonas dhakensis]MBS4717496.1 class I SAM-dependent methyltransferase [Aeromonas dhakensis]BEE01016.1 methyltransferase [Aeromonas dhakensis]HDZ8876657.1 class I SAM-dependent methyltransferase [Aeromonas dhakensis]